MDQTKFVYVQSSFFTETHFFPSANGKRVQCFITRQEMHVVEVALGKKIEVDYKNSNYNVDPRLK